MEIPCWNEQIFPNVLTDDFISCTESLSLDFNVSLWTVIVILAPSVEVLHVDASYTCSSVGSED